MTRRIDRLHREKPEPIYSRNTFAATALFASLSALFLALASLVPVAAQGVPATTVGATATPAAQDRVVGAAPDASAVPVTAAPAAKTAVRAQDAPAGAAVAAPQDLPVRGVIRPSAQAIISTDIQARVTQIGFKAGQPFRSGEILISFDCARLKSELRSAEALHREMQASHRSAVVLLQHKAGARLDVETARARLDRAAADLEGVRLRVQQCSIVAPYDGSVVDITIHEHELPNPGKPLMSIVSRKDPEIELVVPSSWLTWLTPGTKFEFTVEETGKTYPAKVQRLGATADTVSQTLKVFATFSSQAPAVLPGSSGTAKFSNVHG